MPHAPTHLIRTATQDWMAASPEGPNWRTNPGGWLIYGCNVVETADLPHRTADTEADARLERARELAA